MKHDLFGAIEAGGTKFNCAVLDQDFTTVRAVRIPTTTPSETLGAVLEFFDGFCREVATPIQAIGVSCFGPVDLNPESPQYGQITTTPKLAWRNADVVGALRPLGVPIAFDTDVNGAAFGEWACGAARGLDTFVYYTIGTGIGGGGMAGGGLLHGLVHPEMGHVILPHDRAHDPFPGCCPTHGDCFEGLASGPAMAQRWGVDPSTLPADHEAWRLEAHYISVAVANTALMLSPQRIILGGGVMQNEWLFPMVRVGVQRFLNGYVQHSRVLHSIEEFIVPPALGDRAGIVGAAALAAQLYAQQKKW